MENNKTLLITGASGFLGTWLADKASAAGYTLIGIDLRAPLRPNLWANFATSSTESVDFDQLIQGRKLYAVCHLAGGASVASSVSDPYSDFSNLLPGTARMSLYLSRFQSQARLFLFSSAAVYGNPLELPINEDTPILPISPYGIHKAVAESLLTHYARVYNLSVTIFRIFSVYGAGLRKQLIWDVGQQVIAAANSGQQKITLRGTGAESRDFIYVEDLCDAVLHVMDKESKNQVDVFNLASGVEKTIKDVVVSLIHHLGVKVDIDFNGTISSGDPANWRADVSKLNEIGFYPEFTLEQGLEQVAIWLKQQ